MKYVCAFAAAWMLWLAPGLGAAQSAILQDGIHLWEQLDLEEAVATFEAALRSDDISRTDAARAHAYLAALHAMIGNDAEDLVEVHVRIAVALDRRVLPPQEAPTQVRELFTELRETEGEAHLLFEIERGDQGGRRTIYVRPDPAPIGMLASIRVRCADAELATEGDPAGFTFQLPAEGDIECVAEGVSSGGAVWLTRRETLLEDAPVEGRRWKMAVGITAGALALIGAGIAIGLTQRDNSGGDGVVPPAVLTWGGVQ